MSGQWREQNRAKWFPAFDVLRRLDRKVSYLTRMRVQVERHLNELRDKALAQECPTEHETPCRVQECIICADAKDRQDWYGTDQDNISYYLIVSDEEAYEMMARDVKEERERHIAHAKSIVSSGSD